jgi:succinyl-diaminopimelate desuccinylase
MDRKAQLLDRIDRDQEALVGFLGQFVQVPSENPPGDTTKAAEFVAEFLTKRGLPFRTIAPQKTMPNLVGTFQGGRPGKHLVLNGHMDVFPAGDPGLWERPPFSGDVAGGRIWGRGVTDMKAGTAASLFTFAYLHEMRDELCGRLTLTAVSDEETFGPWGARYLMEHHPEVHGDACLNGEPSTPGTVRFGEKGLLWFAVSTRTKGGHGAYFHASANAIDIMSRLLADLKALADIPVEVPARVREAFERARPGLDRYLGAGATDVIPRITVSFGTIRGGLKVNMIAADCQAEVDVRLPVGASRQAVEDRAREIVARYPEASYHFINYSEPAWTDPDHALIRYVRANAKAVRGEDPAPGISLGGTDARLWRQRGIPGVVYGPTPHNMGSPNEYVEISEFLDTVRVHVLSAYDYLT